MPLIHHCISSHKIPWGPDIFLLHSFIQLIKLFFQAYNCLLINFQRIDQKISTSPSRSESFRQNFLGYPLHFSMKQLKAIFPILHIQLQTDVSEASLAVLDSPLDTRDSQANYYTIDFLWKTLLCESPSMCSQWVLLWSHYAFLSLQSPHQYTNSNRFP